MNELRAFDTYQVLSKHLKIDSHSFFKHFCELVDYDNKSTYESTWTHYKQRIRENTTIILKQPLIQI